MKVCIGCHFTCSKCDFETCDRCRGWDIVCSCKKLKKLCDRCLDEHNNNCPEKVDWDVADPRKRPHMSTCPSFSQKGKPMHKKLYQFTVGELEGEEEKEKEKKRKKNGLEYYWNREEVGPKVKSEQKVEEEEFYPEYQLEWDQDPDFYPDVDDLLSGFLTPKQKKTK